jgi:hypothetical protein
MDKIERVLAREGVVGNVYTHLLERNVILCVVISIVQKDAWPRQDDPARLSRHGPRRDEIHVQEQWTTVHRHHRQRT